MRTGWLPGIHILCVLLVQGCVSATAVVPTTTNADEGFDLLLQTQGFEVPMEEEGDTTYGAIPQWLSGKHHY